MDLEEDTGLYFIHELKTRLEEEYILALNDCGVDLYLLKLEQQHLHEQLERKKTIIHHESKSKEEEMKLEMPKYLWAEVATFKFRNNICFLYDKKGNLLDKLPIGKIVEYYVRTLTNFGKLVLKKDEIEITEKQKALLQLLYERDVDEDMALYFLDINKRELNYLLNQLLRYEYLQYISSDEIKLTKKGIELLEQNTEQKPEATAS